MRTIAEMLIVVRTLRSRRLMVLGLLGVFLARLRLRVAAERVFRYARQMTERRYRKEMARAADLWDFLANREAARRGDEHHPDPLLDVAVRRGRRVVVRRRKEDGRTWLIASVGPTGMRLDALLLGPARSVAVLHVDDRPIANLPIGRPIRIPGTSRALSRGTMTLRRPTLERFPSTAVLTLRTDTDGQHIIGKANLDVAVPTGNGSIMRGSFPRVDKKGVPVVGKKSRAALQLQLEDLYGKAAEFFRESLGKDLFLIYGTLLGPIREERFLPWDDDFDVAYFSDMRCWRCLRDETTDVMQRLARAGFDVGLNRRGRPFRLSDERGLGNLRLDVRPVWEMKGAIWAAKHAHLPLNRDHFLPVRTVTIGERDYRVPNDPEAFLAAYYGDDWRTPKPGYREVVELSLKQARTFRRLRMSYKEVLKINKGLAADHEGPSNGQVPALRAYGGVPLYPLEERERAIGF